MTDHSAGQDAAQRSALGGAWNANPFATPQARVAADNTLVNRPANQARVASPGTAAQNARDWQTQNGAVDFLGLEAELTGASQAPMAFAPAPGVAVAPLRAEVPDESWLMGMGEERATRVTAVEGEAEAEADDELVPAEPMLNATWQETDARPRRNKWMLPVFASAAGVLALSGVVWMRNERSVPVADELVLTGEHSSSSSTVAATAATAAPASAPLYTARELTPVAPLATDMAPPPEPALARAREPSDTRVAAESSEGGGLESMIEVVPALAANTWVAPQAPPESAWASDPNDPLYSPAPIESGEEADASANVPGAQAHEADALPELGSSEPQASISAPLPEAVGSAALPALAPAAATQVASDTLAEPVSASSVLDAAPPTSSPEIVLDAQASESPLVEAVALAREVDVTDDLAREVNVTDDALEVASTTTAFATSAQSALIGPTPPGVALSESAPEPLYGPAARDIADEPVVDSSGTVGLVERTSKLELEQVLLLDQGASGMRRANVQDLKGMWTENSIPFESIGAASKVLTPAVGKVRVVLTAGEIFEGDLYAVGEGCVWLNTQYGRMGLSGARVKSVAQIDSPKGTPALGSPGSEALSGLERVRIKTPGGVIYGKVIERDALRTTVMTEDGARLTMDSKDVELLSQTPTVSIKK